MDGKRYEVLSDKISVVERLKQLLKWKADYELTDALAQEKMRALYAEAKAEPNKIKRRRIEQKINNYQIITDRLNFMRIQIPYTLNSEAAGSLDKISNNLKRQYVSLSKADKVLWLNNILFLATPDVRNLGYMLDDMQRSASNHEAYHKLIVAPARNGKTWALNWYAFCHMPQILEEYTFHPLIMVEPLNDDRTKKSLLQQIVLAAGSTYADESYLALISMARAIFSGCGTRLLIIDEIMHLTTYDQRRTVITLSNQGGFGGRLAIVGASVDANRFGLADEEIEGRFQNQFELALYKGEHLQGLLAFIEPLLPFSQTSQLSLHTIEVKKGKTTTSIEGPASFIENATGGRLGYIMPLISKTAKYAIQNDTNITVDLLHNIWKTIPKDPEAE